jgi:hypothetical protein
VNWDLWVYLFRTERHTATTPEPKTRRAVRAGGVTIVVRETRRKLYIPCMMTSNNAEWEQGWFYLRNDEPGLPPWTGKVVKEKADSWWHDLSPSSCQVRLASALKALKALADTGLTAASVLNNLHHRRIVPLMEMADPVALALSRLMPDLLLQEYATTRARRAINLRAMRVDDTALWAFTMLHEGPLVSRVPTPLRFFGSRSVVVICGSTRPLQVMAVNAVWSDPPTPRARACAHEAQRREQERAACKERSIQRWERREQRSEEFRLREQQGLSSTGTSEYSSSDKEEEEESDGGRAPPERWEPSPPRPEPRRRRKRRRLGRARERPPPGILQERRRAPRRWLGARRRLCRWRLQRPPSPQGRGN